MCCIVAVKATRLNEDDLGTRVYIPRLLFPPLGKPPG
jgi:hypothetical protein